MSNKKEEIENVNEMNKTIIVNKTIERMVTTNDYSINKIWEFI